MALKDTKDVKHDTASPKAERNPKSHHFEFMGPHLSPLVIAGLTIVPTLLNSLCSDSKCPQMPASASAEAVIEMLLSTYHRTVATVSQEELITATLVVLSWYAWQAILYLVLPGRVASGTLIRDGTRLTYPINAFSALLLSYFALGVVSYQFGCAPLLWVANNTLSLCLASTALSVAQSLALYAASFRHVDLHSDAKSQKDGKSVTRVPALLAVGGNSGYPFYDFFIGRELNPRIFGFDLKYFCELRPGLIGWTVLNAANAVKQGVLVSGNTEDWRVITGGVSNSMWIVLVFQLYYVIDALWNEQAILTTMDITTDGFGFMLNFGDLVWVPFTYTLQSKFLSMFPLVLSTPAVAGLIALKLFGLYMFRGANGQKNSFRTDPNVPQCKHLKFIETKRGTKLLVSGWWGVARHINYTGDWLMALAWCLPTGFASPIPYFYAFYFAILLWHREMRDELACKEKYGDDWKRYCGIVKYRFIPGIY
ncbi:ergosterol biosynthesis ERG4/ERG24 [Obelidium mucronatum]|nr:ergosterol biosynthesis ERG4/ERG24 [Obelidium mucronatum]